MIKEMPVRKNLFPVFNRNLALMLIDMGNPVVDAAPNKKNPNYVAFYFEDTKKVKDDFHSIVDERENEKDDKNN